MVQPSMNAALPPAVASPCVDICQLDAQSVCLGCGRSIDEIGEWSEASNARRGQINAAAERRRAGREATP